MSEAYYNENHRFTPELFQALRKEIEIRLLRETVYRAVDALNSKISLQPHIDSNDEHIKFIGEFLKNQGDTWEEFYQSKMASK